MYNSHIWLRLKTKSRTHCAKSCNLKYFFGNFPFVFQKSGLERQFFQDKTFLLNILTSKANSFFVNSKNPSVFGQDGEGGAARGAQTIVITKQQQWTSAFFTGPAPHIGMI